MLSVANVIFIEGEIAMTGLEVLKTAQFVTVKGQRLVVLSADDWDALIEWLEDLEDAKIAKQAISALKAANGDREKAGWLEWSEVG
jgi:PHD/YefM family antitoxin component YafN of YafNO toxin-antitoxin module